MVYLQTPGSIFDVPNNKMDKKHNHYQIVVSTHSVRVDFFSLVSWAKILFFTPKKKKKGLGIFLVN